MAVPSLVKALEDSSHLDIKRKNHAFQAAPSVRVAAARALGEIGEDASIVLPAILDVLRREGLLGRRNILDESLCGFGVPSIPILIEALRDDDPSVQFGCCSALLKMGCRVCPYASKLIPELANTSMIQLFPAGNRIIYQNVSQILASCRHHIIPDLKQGLLHEDPIVRCRCAILLSRLNPPGEINIRIRTVLIDGLRLPAVQDEAADALSCLGGSARDAIPALLDVMSKQEEFYYACAAVLAHIDPASPILNQSLKKLDINLKIRDIEMRSEATELLPKFGPIAVGRLISMIDDEELVIRQCALRGLMQLGAEAGMAVPILLEKMVSCQNEEERQLIFGTIKHIKTSRPLFITPKMLSAIFKLLEIDADESNGEFFSRIGRPAVAPLVAILKGGRRNPILDRNAVLALGAIGPEAADAVPILIDLFDRRTDLANDCIDSLGLIGSASAPAIERLITALKTSPDESSLALSRVGEPAIPALIDALKNENSSVRRGAIRTLGLLGSRATAALPLLGSLAAGNSSDRTTALAALGWIGASAGPFKSSLMRAMNDQESEVRAIACEALSNQSSISSHEITVLANALKDSSLTVRLGAAQALRKFAANSPASADALHQALFDSYQVVRDVADSVNCNNPRLSTP